MGVHGLTTYLREHQRALSKPLVLDSSASNASIPIVVDGWSFIYALHAQSQLPWVYGGEYAAFHDLVVKVVRAWIRVGLQPHFVFDGPYPSAKCPTIILRVTESVIKPSLLFFRTSPSSRATPSFMRANAILPPLCYPTILEALRSLNDSVVVHFADDEGDPYCVELAGRLGGYVVTQDSDFVIYNTDGYAGYIPMDHMVWNTSSPEKTAPQDDGGFVAARRPKARDTQKQSGQGLIPPETSDQLSLTCTVFSPTALSAHFQLSLSLLPLFAALAGNDYTVERRPVHTLFFEHGMTASQRVARVANALRSAASAVSGSPQKRKTKRPMTSVVDFIDAAVETLLVRPSSTMASGEREAIVEKTVQATLAYSIPSQGGSSLYPTPACALHTPDTCPLVDSLSQPILGSSDGDELPSRTRCRKLYLSAYRKGRLSPRIMDIITAGTSWPKLFLEDPDLEAVARSIGRPIREWVYAILEDGIGLPVAEEAEDNEEEVDESDEDELVDVVEDDSDDELGVGDPLAPLQGALQELHTGARPPGSMSSYASMRNQPPKVIIEHLRRGGRVADEKVTVPKLHQFLSGFGINVNENEEYIPIQLQDEDRRFDIFLRILGSYTTAVRDLQSSQLMHILALRWVVGHLRDRASESPSPEREKEKWTHNEAKASIASFMPEPIVQDSAPLPSITNRNVQLTAQVLAAVEAIEMLSQALLLTQQVPSPTHLFAGSTFHALLTGERKMSTPLSPQLWEAIAGGNEDAFGIERGKKAKKERKSPGGNSQSGRSIVASSSSVFGMLADIDDA
ncbi:PIN domain-like protein [Auriscalpium vulgare]|uniref:PIN domain-like protein n=1 Tax=Auriscalpium vulgare TaxID=40419 RepID=A0ACB8RL55_9AGAM|nr:PIN domain-like protein [Auriscalpium vulgare]